MGGSFHNNICTLENDVILYESSMLASKEFPFVGEFDGKGHTITLSGNVTEPLFGYIGEGGVVKNLNIEVVMAAMNTKEGAILALENYGTIINCKITLKNAKIGNSGNHAAVVAVNRGSIRNVVVKSEFENIVTGTRRSIIGGVVAYNYGEIVSCIANTSFISYPETDKNNVFSGSAANTSIGAVCGINNGIIKRSIAVVSENTYVADNKINSKTEITFVDGNNKSEVFSADNLFGNLGFDDELWIFLDDELSLIQGDD